MVKKHIQTLIDLETEGWNTKNPDLFLSMIHPDMVWPWPPNASAHDPADWVFRSGEISTEPDGEKTGKISLIITI